MINPNDIADALIRDMDGPPDFKCPDILRAQLLLAIAAVQLNGVEFTPELILEIADGERDESGWPVKVPTSTAMVFLESTMQEIFDAA